MLIQSMNFEEIQVEVNIEYEILCGSSTLNRLIVEYASVRKKLKIKAHEKFVKFYTIKTKKKNNWLIMISLNEDGKKTNSIEDYGTTCFLYYQSIKGIRLILTTPSKVISIYNAHLFIRYNERLQLNISSTLEIAKHFFEKNNLLTFQSFPIQDNKRKIMGILTNGFALGEIYLYENSMILHYKTFISRETANMKHAKSLFELEKIYKNNDDHESKQFYETLGFDELKEDNSLFFEQWEKLRTTIINDDQQYQYYVVK
jgi:hypothetical protein